MLYWFIDKLAFYVGIELMQLYEPYDSNINRKIRYYRIVHAGYLFTVHNFHLHLRSVYSRYGVKLVNNVIKSYSLHSFQTSLYVVYLYHHCNYEWIDYIIRLKTVWWFIKLSNSYDTQVIIYCLTKYLRFYCRCLQFLYQ